MRRHLEETDSLRQTPQVGGFRLESPYLADPSAGLPQDCAPVSDALTGRLLEAGQGRIRLWDLSPELPGAVLPLFDERFERLWQAIGEIRRQAAPYLIQDSDLRPYWMSLLQATLPVLYYQNAQFASEASERQQKRCALLAAGLLCAKL